MSRTSDSMILREFQCPECGERLFAPKKRASKKFHCKKLYCWKCMKDQNFILVDQERRKA